MTFLKTAHGFLACGSRAMLMVEYDRKNGTDWTVSRLDRGISVAVAILGATVMVAFYAKRKI